MTLHRLLTLSLISRYDQYTWFRDCTLEKTIILCPSKELAASLTRCWLPQIQRVLPDCTVRVGTAPPSAKTVYRGQISSPYQARLED